MIYSLCKISLLFLRKNNFHKNFSHNPKGLFIDLIKGIAGGVPVFKETAVGRGWIEMDYVDGRDFADFVDEIVIIVDIAAVFIQEIILVTKSGGDILDFLHLIGCKIH